METKLCKTCGSIYPVTDERCPSCGSKRWKYRKKTGVNDLNKPVRTQLVEVYVQEKKGLLSAILAVLLLGRAGVLWAAHMMQKPKPKRATFIVYSKNGKRYWKTVDVGSEKYYEYLRYSE